MVNVPRQDHQPGGVGAVEKIKEAFAAVGEVPPRLHERVRREHLHDDLISFDCDDSLDLGQMCCS